MKYLTKSLIKVKPKRIVLITMLGLFYLPNAIAATQDELEARINLLEQKLIALSNESIDLKKQLIESNKQIAELSLNLEKQQLVISNQQKEIKIQTAALKQQKSVNLQPVSVTHPTNNNAIVLVTDSQTNEEQNSNIATKKSFTLTEFKDYIKEEIGFSFNGYFRGGWSTSMNGKPKNYAEGALGRFGNEYGGWYDLVFRQKVYDQDGR